MGESPGRCYQAMGLNLAVTTGALALGVAVESLGVQMVAVALTLVMPAKLALLGQRIPRRLAG